MPYEIMNFCIDCLHCIKGKNEGGNDYLCRCPQINLVVGTVPSLRRKFCVEARTNENQCGQVGHWFQAKESV
jgi:hypothetical protein